MGRVEMATYRAYTVGLDGRYIGFTELDCADDSEAIEVAKQLNGGRDIELWCGDRFVVRINYKSSA